MSKPYSQYTKDDLMSMLESLTPGGSEFHQSPENCVQHIQDRRRFSVVATLKRRDAEKQRDELLAACQALIEATAYYLTQYEEDGYIDIDSHVMVEEARQLAVAAIARATGD